MTLSKKEQHLELDSRLRERFLRDELVDRKVIEKYLKDLPDLAAEAEEVPAYEEPSDNSEAEAADEVAVAEAGPTFTAADV